MTQSWHGVIPALMTEMKQDGSLDLQSTARHIESCLAAGCQGFVMLGTLGENSSLSLDEKDAVVRAALEAVSGRVPVIAGVAEYTTDLALEAARRSKKAGAAGLMALPTMVYQQDSREAIQHFRTLARGTDLPIMVYNNHVAYKVDLSPDDFTQLTGGDEHRGGQGVEPRQPPRHRHDQQAWRSVRAVLRGRRPRPGERAVRRGRLGIGDGQQFSARGSPSCSNSPKPDEQRKRSRFTGGSCRCCTSIRR